MSTQEATMAASSIDQEHVSELADRLDELEDELEAERAARQALEAKLEKTQVSVWDIEEAVLGDLAPYPDKLEEITDEHGTIFERVDDLENTEPADQINRGTLLPIQRMTKDRKSGTHNLTENQERATYVWPDFHSRAIPEGGLLKVQSAQVRNILHENGLDTNPNTVKRVMEQLAQHTSHDPEAGPESPENLIQLVTATGKNVLVAEKAEFEAFVAGLENELDPAADDSEEHSDEAPSSTDKTTAEKEMDEILFATPTNDADDSARREKEEDITLS